MNTFKAQISPPSSPEDIRRQAEILQLTHEAIIVHDIEDGRVIFWNRGATELYGWTEEEAIGQVTHDLLKTKFPPKIEDILAQVHDTGQWNGELIHTAKAGSQIIVASRWSRRNDRQGDICDIVEINFDVTAKKIAEERAREHEHLASLGTVAAVLTHEIANPLTAISGAIQNLQMQIQDGLNSPELARWITTLEGEINRLTVLLEDFRSLTRPFCVSLYPIDLVEILEEILVFDEPACRAAGIEVVRDYSPIPLVQGDWNRMKQAMLNLFKNAIEAMPQGGQLAVKTYATEDRVYVELKDTGSGIPQGLDVFAMFKTTKPNGTGLGLPFVKQIISAHQGTIDYVSEPGRGTTFKISLPIHRTPAALDFGRNL